MPVTASEIASVRLMLDRLKISRIDQDVFLGCKGTEIRNAPRHWSAVPDIEERVSYLRAIDTTLRSLFSAYGRSSFQDEMIALWLLTPGNDFGGGNALQMMRGGELDNLKFVYDKLFDEFLENRR